ncbi:MAG TPA: sulfur oxidation c-type cytochrome SoxA [Pseudomonadales bacterium]|nr:sulfur oxidation c-type cytochrome SoxA [Pseudomonadales bacterium]
MTTLHNKRAHLGIAALCAMLLAPITVAQDDDVFAEYRAMMGDENPAIFTIEEGQELWETPMGPKNVSLEQCDLGLGPGVVEGALAQLPRYFEDAKAVQDVEARLLYCMETLQGRDVIELLDKPYSSIGEQGTELEALVAFVADRSMDAVVNLPQGHPAEQAMYKKGEEIFYYRAGPHDFSCATCHSQTDKRIRLQALPNLTTNEGAGFAFTTWPGYRISEGLLRTMGWRMQSCGRQQRLPQFQSGSEAVIALETFMGVNAKGAVMAAPGLKR